MTDPLNRDINSRFADWLISPSEALDFEVKSWLDLSDPEARGAIAKALIALENHGGGFLLIGYRRNEEGRLVPDSQRPANLAQYGTDEINAIIKKCAEPSFHAQVTFQRHPDTNDEFPLVRVAGSSMAPVRSRSETPNKSLRPNVYYIRRPGPASEAPMDGAEWDALIRRCVLKHRGEIIDDLRSFVPSAAAGNIQSLVDEREVLNQYVRDSFARWTVINNALADNHPSRIKHGWFAFACQITGRTRSLSPKDLLDAVDRLRRYTGWPIFIVARQSGLDPYLKDGAIEASLIGSIHPNPSHADFWRIHPDGLFYLLRGYQEDCLAELTGNNKSRDPGTGIDLTLPVWRVAEFLLRSEELARAMFEDGFVMRVRCEWSGLQGRELFVFNSMRWLAEGHRCQAPTVITEETLTQSAITELLSESVKRLTAPLYNHFDFFQPPDKLYEEEIHRMMTGQLG